jgi:hypothetical protein
MSWMLLQFARRSTTTLGGEAWVDWLYSGGEQGELAVVVEDPSRAVMSIVPVQGPYWGSSAPAAGAVVVTATRAVVASVAAMTVASGVWAPWVVFLGWVSALLGVLRTCDMARRGLLPGW